MLSPDAAYPLNIAHTNVLGVYVCSLSYDLVLHAIRITLAVAPMSVRVYTLEPHFTNNAHSLVRPVTPSLRHSPPTAG